MMAVRQDGTLCSGCLLTCVKEAAQERDDEELLALAEMMDDSPPDAGGAASLPQPTQPNATQARRTLLHLTWSVS
jgi:rhamnogalacturonyl hydrolase YesR